MDKMTNSLGFVKDVVTSSELPEEDKQMVLERLSGVPNEVVELLERILKEDSTLLGKVVESLKVKIAAEGDERALEKIARTEEKEITKILNA
ncbi:hypothetical protein K2X83_02075 [Patescibacteria group bacterium]|nr:hypothetical protein [Patescibacteria group bacterium]